MRNFLFCLVLFAFSKSFTQSKWIVSDTFNKKRTIFTSIFQGSIFTGSFIGLQQVWYKDYEKTKLHFFNDASNWMQMDKLGHAFASYHFSELSSNMFIWSGMHRKKAAILGASIAFTYQFSIEMLDGFSKNWGFSISDVLANGLGNVLFLSQEILLKKQFVKFKFSFYSSPYAKYRPEVLGNSFSEQILKDYNGQIYWLSFSPFTRLKNKKLNFISLALGYSCDAKIFGDNNYFKDPISNKSFEARREFMLSLDLDVKALKIQNRYLKMLLSPFNSIKIPFPTLIWRGNKFYGSFY